MPPCAASGDSAGGRGDSLLPRVRLDARLGTAARLQLLNVELSRPAPAQLPARRARNGPRRADPDRVYRISCPLKAGPDAKGDVLIGDLTRISGTLHHDYHSLR